METYKYKKVIIDLEKGELNIVGDYESNTISQDTVNEWFKSSVVHTKDDMEAVECFVEFLNNKL